MPPKKPVLTKAQKRKLEEEERKRKEEEKRLLDEKLAIEERKLQEELEKKRKAAEDLFNSEEKDRLKLEERDFMHYDLNLAKAIQKQEDKFNKELEWKRYVGQYDRTNINDIKQVNELVSSFRELRIFSFYTGIEKKLDVEPMMKIIGEVQLICHELKIMELKYKIQKNRKDMELCKKFIQDFQNLTMEKIQEISYHIKSHSDSFLPDSDMQANKEDQKKGGSNKSGMVCLSKPDVRLGFLVSYADKNHPRAWIDFPEAQIGTGVPLSLKLGDFIMRVVWTSFDYLSTEPYSKEMIIGGILNTTPFEMPPIPTPYKGWKIKHVIEIEAALSESSLIKNDLQIQKGNANLIRIKYKLPPNLYVGDISKKQMGIWLKEKKEWAVDSEYIERENINFLEGGMLEFQTYRLAPSCLVQSRFLDFPYLSWKIRSKSENDIALIDIETKRITLKFEIGSGYVKLKKSFEKELSHLYEKEMEPAELLYELYRSGINLLPIDEDAEHCGMSLKNTDAEEKAINDITLASRAYYFKNSKWSAHSPKGPH